MSGAVSWHAGPLEAGAAAYWLRAGAQHAGVLGAAAAGRDQLTHRVLDGRGAADGSTPRSHGAEELPTLRECCLARQRDSQNTYGPSGQRVMRALVSDTTRHTADATNADTQPTSGTFLQCFVAAGFELCPAPTDSRPGHSTVGPSKA